MKAWFRRIQSWRARRKLRSLQWWEQKRAKGKARFVIETALTYGFMVVGATDVIENLFYGRQYVSLGHLISSLLTGIPVALVGWSRWENEYKRALHEARLNALPSAKIMPSGKV